MVKYQGKKEDCELSTSQSMFTESEPINSPCTLTTLIQQLPKLTPLEKKNGYRTIQASKNHSRKWSQAETRTFHQLLRHYGLDFTLMSYHPAFLHVRSQKELSNKYKKQQRIRPHIIETILDDIEGGKLYSNEADS